MCADHWRTVKPAKVGSDTNLNLVTASGQVYAFVLTEISEVAGAEPDLRVYIEPDDPASFRPWQERPKYVPAQQVEDLRAQVARAQQDTREKTQAVQTQLEEGLTKLPDHVSAESEVCVPLRTPCRAVLCARDVSR